MANVKGDSATTNIPAVFGENTAGGDGISGKGRRGVVGISNDFQGVFGKSVENAGVVGESDKLHGLFGVCHNPNGGGVFGTNDKGGFGVIGVSDSGIGVSGDSKTGDGVRGTGRRGVVGISNDFQGVFGHSNTNAGVVGESDNFDGVFGVSHNPKAAGVSGHNPGGLAGFFDGNVTVTGDVILTGADCAEEFDIVGVENVESGTVMVINEEGALRVSDQPYDRRVAGVVSGAGDYKPGLVLDRQQSQNDRKPIALIGKAYCKVDAQFGAIEVGDLLTTSPTPGHAMRADDPMKAYGTVIGKALRPLKEGQGLIPILVTLQ
ncbi:MAG: hypothetical protein ACRERU_14195 [Methylococcales bacterium]